MFTRGARQNCSKTQNHQPRNERPRPDHDLYPDRVPRTLHMRKMVVLLGNAESSGLTIPATHLLLLREGA